MSDTPRTDAAWEAALRLPGGGYSANPNTLGLAVEMSRFAKELERELDAERAIADRLAASLEDCRDDSAELLSDHSWWQDEPRCGYAERYKENAKNITRAVEALAAWKEARK